MRRAVIVLVITAMATGLGCSESATTGPPTTLPPASTGAVPTTTTVAPATVGTPPPTQSSTTSSVPAVPAPGVSEPSVIAPADFSGPGLEWVRAAATVDRHFDLWLGSTGDRHLLVMWSSVDGLWIRTSQTGVVWDPPMPALGVPDGFRPILDDGPMAPQAASVGVIMAAEATGSVTADAPVIVLTSLDGTVWQTAELDTSGAPIVSIGASADRFIAVGGTSGSSSAWVSPDGTDWMEIDLRAPTTGYWEPTVLSASDRFLIVSPDRPIALVDASFTGYMPQPSAGDPLLTHSAPLEDGIIAVARGSFGGSAPWRMAVIGTTDYSTWFELPVPLLSDPAADRRGGAYWAPADIAAESGGIVITAYYPGEVFDFWGEGFVGIDFSVGELNGVVFGADVSIMTPEPDSISPSFDAAGTLRIRDSATGALRATITCEEMRATARAIDHLVGRLIEWPAQRILFSPAGAAWSERDTGDAFGLGAYVLAVAMTEGAIVALVAPSGEPPIPDPPNCPLGLYPTVGPYELWVATLE